MDPFKRSTLLTTQAALGLITSDEVRSEMQTLIPLMQSDPESQPTKAAAEQETPPEGYKQSQY
jgi:hypothetical protein